MKAGELVIECENKVSYKNPEFWKDYVLIHSFTGNFEYYRKNIENLEKEELEKFIEICDIKVEWAKTLMKEVGTVFSFGITILSFAFAVVWNIVNIYGDRSIFSKKPSSFRHLK